MTRKKAVLEENFPDMYLPGCKNSSPYSGKDEAYFLNIFMENYERIKKQKRVHTVSQKSYIKYRMDGTPHIKTIQNHCNCKTYGELLTLCGYKSENKPLIATMDISFNDNDDNFAELEQMFDKFKNRKK